MGGSSVMADAGRAMMLYRGLYESTHTYEKLDVVNFNGSLYISTTDGNLGTEPTDVTKWKLFLQGGVSDNIQATDTYGLVGEAGENSFVQLLLDSLASRVQGVALNRQTLGYSKKNLLKNTATNTTSNGVTFVVNEDGSITANGTATGYTEKYLCSFVPTPNETYIFDAVNGENVNWNYVCYIKGIDGSEKWKSESGGYKFTPATNHSIGCYIYIAKGTTLENFTFYPMIRSADIEDDTYEPYVDDVDTRLQKIDDSILNTLEEIDANTSEGNIAGALAVKSLKSNLTNSIDAKANLISNSFADASAREFDLADILISTDSKFAMLVSARGHVATDKGGSLYFVSGMSASQYVQVIKICGDDTYSPQISVADGKITIQTYDTNGCNFSILKLLN